MTINSIKTVLKMPWQAQLRHAIRTWDQLTEVTTIPQTFMPFSASSVRNFPLLVTHSFAARIKPNCVNDPLLRQILPISAELDSALGGELDPVGDLPAQKTPGLLHKYTSRALVLSTSACAIHCRYCFRRNFPYNELPQNNNDIESAFAYIEMHSELEEIILSGGDPLTLVPQRLNRLLSRLATIPHINTIRIHTRIPIVLPARIDQDLCDTLAGTGKKIVIVLHCNHPQELSGECPDAIRTLQSYQFTLLNQSVLLKGVNDQASVLATLSRQLFAIGVLPYYLHQFDEVQGGMHFAVAEERGRALIKELQSLVSGYLVPRYAREIPGERSKTLLI